MSGTHLGCGSLFTNLQAQWDLGQISKSSFAFTVKLHLQKHSFFCLASPPRRIRGQKAGSHVEKRLQSGVRKDLSVENLQLLSVLFHLSMWHIHTRREFDLTVRNRLFVLSCTINSTVVYLQWLFYYNPRLPKFSKCSQISKKYIKIIIFILNRNNTYELPYLETLKRC